MLLVVDEPVSCHDTTYDKGNFKNWVLLHLETLIHYLCHDGCSGHTEASFGRRLLTRNLRRKVTNRPHENGSKASLFQIYLGSNEQADSSLVIELAGVAVIDVVPVGLPR